MDREVISNIDFSAILEDELSYESITIVSLEACSFKLIKTQVWFFQQNHRDEGVEVREWHSFVIVFKFFRCKLYLNLLVVEPLWKLCNEMCQLCTVAMGLTASSLE